MNRPTQYFLAITAVALAATAFFGCARDATKYTYSCGTPIGLVEISSETDTGISLENGLLRASRSGDSIIIPMTQCVAIKRGKK